MRVEGCSKSAWIREYSSSGLPSTIKNTPSHGSIALHDAFNNLDLPSKMNMLDLGCGTGRNAVYFAQKGHHVVAIDFVETVANTVNSLAQKNLVEERVDFIHHDVRQPLPFEAGQFHVVYAMTTIENLLSDTDIRKLAEDVHRILKPGGLLALYYLTDQDEFYGPRVQTDCLPKKIVAAEDTHMTQRVFDSDELATLFGPKLYPVSLSEFTFPDARFGHIYQRHLELLLLRK